MAVAGASSSFVGDDSTVASDSPIATNPDDDGHKEGGKKKKNRCLSCKKKVGLTGKLIDYLINLHLLHFSERFIIWYKVFYLVCMYFEVERI